MNTDIFTDNYAEIVAYVVSDGLEEGISLKKNTSLPWGNRDNHTILSGRDKDGKHYNVFISVDGIDVDVWDGMTCIEQEHYGIDYIMELMQEV